MKDSTAYSELCFNWAEAFGVSDLIIQSIQKKHKGISKILEEIGIPLEDYIIAEIFELDFDGSDFSINEYSCGYFHGKELSDIVTYSDLIEIEKQYKLIEDYVKENYSGIKRQDVF